MRGQKTSLTILLSNEEQEQLQQWIRSSTMPAGKVRRARVIVLRSQGVPLVQIGRKLQMTERNVRKWCNRFLTLRLEGLDDLPRSGRKPSFSP